MTLIKALEAMREDKKVRRRAWGKYCYICISREYDTQTLVFVTHTGQIINLSAESLFCTDWEVVND